MGGCGIRKWTARSTRDLGLLNQANVQAINLGMAVNENLESSTAAWGFLEALVMARESKQPVTVRLVVAEDVALASPYRRAADHRIEFFAGVQ